MASYGYARVSSLDQDLTVQRQALPSGGVQRDLAPRRQAAADAPDASRKRRSCAAGQLLRVRLTERAFCLTDCARDGPLRLKQCASKLVVDCKSGHL